VTFTPHRPDKVTCQKVGTHLAPFAFLATSNKQRQKTGHLTNSLRLEFFHGVKGEVQKVS
jgi:hypothetical protein